MLYRVGSATSVKMKERPTVNERVARYCFESRQLDFRITEYFNNADNIVSSVVVGHKNKAFSMFGSWGRV